MRKKYTIIAFYEDNNEVVSDVETAENSLEALKKFAKKRKHNPYVKIVEILPGNLTGMSEMPDVLNSGDLVGLEEVKSC